jgi:hypothetical protein
MPHVLEGDELTEGFAAGKWAKFGVNQLGKLVRWRRAIDILVLVIPQLVVIHQMEGGDAKLPTFLASNVRCAPKKRMQ